MLIMLCFIILPGPPSWIKVQRRFRRGIPRGYNENPQRGNIFLNYFMACSSYADVERTTSIVNFIWIVFHLRIMPLLVISSASDYNGICFSITQLHKYNVAPLLFVFNLFRSKMAIMIYTLKHIFILFRNITMLAIINWRRSFLSDFHKISTQFRANSR